MTSRLNWRNASLSAKRSTSIVDEDERLQADRAARWLAKVEAGKGKRKACSRTKRKGTAA